MNLSPSIDLIWRLAANEMAAGEFKEIEPEHFCMALLKFGEIALAAVEPDNEHAETAKSIAADVELVREALRRCGIESTRARRKLRGELGNGGTPHHDENAHRSPASRALFETAASFVADSGSETLTPLHLLTALVHSPTPAIAKAVLGRAPGPPAPAIVPMLDKYGEDLVKKAAKLRLRADSVAESSNKAVLQVLLRRDRKSILLITDHEELAEKVVIGIASKMAGEERPAALEGRRLIDIGASSQTFLKEAEQLERLRQLLAAAASHPETILLVPAVEVESNTGAGSQWTGLLRDTLEKGKTQFICRVSPKVFMEHLHQEPVWKRQTVPVWIDKVPVGTVPREL